MRCYEDNETPRLQESLELFGETVNSKWFTETPIILFMNKIDLFNEKINTSPITSMFPEYEGGQDAEKSIEYIKSKFLERSRYKDRTIVCHHTAATNTESLQKAFDAIADILVNSKPTRTTV
jgi:GTPase SAR1 family protein